MYFIVTCIRLYISRLSMVFTRQSYGKCKLAFSAQQRTLDSTTPSWERV